MPEQTSLFRKCCRCGNIMELKKPVTALILPGATEDEADRELAEWKMLRDHPEAKVGHPAGECPEEIQERMLAQMGQHQYQVHIIVERDGETVASLKSPVHTAITWGDAAPELSKSLTERWAQVAQMGYMIDVEPEGSAVVEAVSDDGSDPEG